MKFQTRRSGIILAAMISVALAGCEKTPSGQIVAVVNGEEISLAELNAELDGINIPQAADKEKVRRQVLQQIVDRRLLAQAAKEEGLDKDPAYIVQQRKLNEELLIRMYAKKAADTVRMPDAKAIDQYVAANPSVFEGRKRYTVDQIQFDMPAKPEDLKRLEGDHSLAEVSATLTEMGIKFEQGKGAIDSGSVPPEVLKQILALPPGEPFVTPAGGKVVVSVITGSQPLTVPAEQTKPMAVQAIRNEALSKIGEERLKEAKAKAEIKYQPGFEPEADKKPAKAAPAKS